jgi:hypothetical protein
MRLIAELPLDVVENHQEAGQADAEADDVQEAVEPLFPENSPSDFQVMLDHDSSPVNGIPGEPGQGPEKGEPEGGAGRNGSSSGDPPSVVLLVIPHDLVICLLPDEEPEKELGGAGESVLFPGHGGLT